MSLRDNWFRDAFRDHGPLWLGPKKRRMLGDVLEHLYEELQQKEIEMSALKDAIAKNTAETKRIAAAYEALMEKYVHRGITLAEGDKEREALKAQVAAMQTELEEAAGMIDADTAEEEQIGKDTGGSMGGVTE